MRKIIDGKRYDTDTAECVHAWDNGRYSSDFRVRKKTLYRTQKGSWFIHHYGGPMTDMAVPVGSSGMGGSSDIEPVTEDDARRFLETHAGVDALEKWFAEAIEDA